MSLMEKPPMGQLRGDAERHDEWATKRFWNHVLSKWVFYEFNWIVSTEQPPVAIGSQRRVDIVVENAEASGSHLLMFVEAKKGRAGPRDITEVEHQAYTACVEYCLWNGKRDRVWAMTCYGPCVRLWAFQSDLDQLEPYLPRDYESGNKSLYLDIKTHEDEIMTAFKYIKRHPSPPQKLFVTAESSSTASEVLTAKTATPVQVFELGPNGLEVRDLKNNRINTVRERWEPAQFLVDGVVQDGYKYVGNSGRVLFTVNIP